MPIKYFEYFKRKLFFPKKFGKSYEDNFQSKLLLKKKTWSAWFAFLFHMLHRFCV